MLKSGKQRLLITLLFIGIIATMPLNIFAASSGKIKGVITDKDSGEPVIGASVLIEGTRFGSMTDFEGKFMIPRVEPGTYNLVITHLDYAKVTLTDLNVKSDITTEHNYKLSKKVTALDKEIKVVAKNDILDKFVVSNEVTITKEKIQAQPVTTVDELLSQISGVVTNSSGEVFIRGGRAGEVGYIVDGVPLNDPLGGLGQAGANLSLVSGSIQEFTVIKDGFDPEYGDALSGIVKLTTQTGSKDVTRINTQYVTDDFGTADLNKYSRNYDFIRFSISGPDPIFKNKILPALGINYFKEKELTYYFYAEMDKNDGVYQYESYDTPETRRDDGYFNLLGLHLPERLYNRYYWMFNIKFRPTQNMNMIFSYKNSQTQRNLFSWTYRYSPATAPYQVDKWSTVSLEVSQQVSRNMSYEIVTSYRRTSTSQKPGDPNNPGHGLDPDDFPFDYEWERYDDRNNNGVYDPPEPILNLFPDTMEYGTNYTGPAYTMGELNLDRNNQGAEIEFSDFRFNDNGYADSLQGEPFVDLNGNGVWDAGDYLYDKNGNGLLDAGLEPNINTRTPEPFVDGDSIIGEPYIDENGNGIYDQGIDVFIRSSGSDNMDLNHDGRHNGPNDPWEPGIPFIDRNGNGLYDPRNFVYDIGEQFKDVNGNGYWDGGGSSTFFDPLTFSETSLWHFHEVETYRGEIKLFLQLGNHELKLGGALQNEDFIYQEIEKPYLQYTGRPDGGPFPDRGAFRDMFAYNPWSGTMYFRDKLEYGSMIASLGLRWDFFLQDKHDLVEVARNDDLGSGIILGDRQKISPRIGFSYPISDKAKVHFNYGHFFQRPALTYMYQRNTSSVNLSTVIGNYNLDYQKTIQYSFGVKYALNENYSIDVSGYFKDEFDKINSQSVRVGGLIRQQYRNSDYGRSRGFEMTIEKRGGGYVHGMLSYVYAFAYGKASQTNSDYLTDFQLSREPLDEAPLTNDVRHAIRSSIQVFIPKTVKPRLFGIPIPNGWSMVVVTFIESGRPYTPTKDYPNIFTAAGEDIQRNSLRKPAVINFDLRFTKDFTLLGMDNKFILQVENVFNSKNITGVYSNTGRADTDTNASGIIKGGTAFANNPGNYDYGRQIRFGVEINL